MRYQIAAQARMALGRSGAAAGASAAGATYLISRHYIESGLHQRGFYTNISN
jgi:hypothetical protein